MGSCSARLCRRQRCPLAAASPPPQSHLLLRTSPRVASFLSQSISFPLVASRACATTTPSAARPPPPRRRGALTTGPYFSYLSCVVVSLQRLHLVLPVPVPNSERSTHISPPPSPLAPATHGTPVGSHHQTLSAPVHSCASFPVAHWCSSTTRCPPIATGASSPTTTVRRRLRPHRGQLTPSSSAPPQPPSQHYITPVKLPDPSISPLVHHIDSLMLAGVPPHRRRFCLRRSPLIQHIFIQLVARIRSPCLTEARAQVCCRRSPPEPRRRR
jgi:hypothetical protein